MGLIDLQTDLKSLKFGKDRFGGGDSGQPFIKTPIIEEPGKLAKLETEDFLLRGGVRAPLKALEDVVRLTKYVFNPKSPSGLLFTLKQNLLSRVSVKTEASKGLGYAGGALNAGVYTPLSTLAQAGVGFLGGHLNKQGLDPTGLINSLSINKYEDIIKEQDENRLVTLTNLIFNKKPEPRNNFNSTKGYNLNVGDSIIEYGGGPGSILGIGKTRIKFADQRTGVNSPSYKNNFRGGSNRELEYNFEKIFVGDRGNFTLSTIYSNLTGTPLDKLINIDDGGKSTLIQDSYNVYEKGTLNPNNFLPQSATPPEKTKEDSIKGYPKLFQASTKVSTTLNPNLTSSIDGDKIPSYTPTAPLSTDKIKNTFINLNSSYNHTLNQAQITGKQTPPPLTIDTDEVVETRVGIGSPGAQKGSKAVVLDKLNSLTSIYHTNGPVGGYKDDYNDLVHFRIGIIDPQNPINVTYMNFRSYIDSFSDSYGADWKSQQYMGRGEKFYKYQSFNRDISLSFTIVAQSQRELYGMYKKLNYLASSLAPKYTSGGYMAGNLSKLTFGNYVFEQTGFISSLTYDIPTESTWEIDYGSGDKDMDELPLMIKVTGLKFTPIHNFRPEVGYKNRFITKDLKHVTEKPGPQKGKASEIEDRRIALELKKSENELKAFQAENDALIAASLERQNLENLANFNAINGANAAIPLPPPT